MLMSASATVKLSSTANLIFYLAVWAICLAGGWIVIRAARRSPRFPRWTTRDILVVAAMSVVLEVYDNIIGDQFIGPLITPIPGANLLQLQDIVYVFLLLVGVAIVRKPGCITAMVFINYLLAQLLFGTTHGPLIWPDGLTQGIFCDLYIVARRGGVCAPGGRRWALLVDGLAIGALRGGPNAFLTDWVFDPYLNAQFYTLQQMFTDTWSNAVGNGVEGAITAPLAMRVAAAVVPGLGAAGAGHDGVLSVLDRADPPSHVAADEVPGAASTGGPS